HVLPVALSPQSGAESISGGGSLISSQGGASSLENGESEDSSGAEALVTETLYESESVRAELLSYEQDGIVCHVIDIYIDDISSLRSYFAEGTYGRGFREHPLDMALAVGAVCAINGDYYGNSTENGVVIRNGVLYRSEPNADVCVLYSDGIMETYSAEEFDAEEAMELGAWQAWCFGPSLLDEDGAALSDFSSRVASRNPRTAIGYYEPGHYCFVTVDGRSEDSDGMTLAQLAAFMESLGCEVAYNLDGGKTSVMTFGSEIVNEPVDGGRTSSDIIYIAAE
ncbi:MAG: phosphodiester glycosidase family protein, partial [Oscillospiraceae bacterium]|nr:phosphodiester glycosidase family protein [Oscillospiraceae bacterium]